MLQNLVLCHFSQAQVSAFHQWTAVSIHCHCCNFLVRLQLGHKIYQGWQPSAVAVHSLMIPANSRSCSSSRNIKEFQRDLRFSHSLTVLFTIPPKSTLYLKEKNQAAKFSFDILGINAQNWKVNKCSHKNKSEQMSIWAYEETADHHPCGFCQVYMCLLTKIKNCDEIKITNTKGEGMIDLTNLE